MGSLRIVLVLIDPPLPFGSAAARSAFVLMKGLVARGHRVTALAACSKPEEMERARETFPAPGYDLRLFPFPARSGPRAKGETALRPYSFMFGADFRGALAPVL